MKKINFQVINSFALNKFGGNPAGVVLNSDALNKAEMQKIAKQLNLVETVFVKKSSDGNVDYDLRYFTPQKELPIAGHPTIAAWIAIIQNLEKRPDKNTFVQRTKKGKQKIFIEKNKNVVVKMQQLQPSFKNITEDEEAIAGIFKINKKDILNKYPIQAVNVGLGHIIFAVKNLKALMKIRRDIEPLKKICNQYDVHEAQIFCFETRDKKYDIHSRNISPREGIEDPACGNGNGALMAYLLKNKYPINNTFTLRVEQGYVNNMPSLINISGRRDENDFYYIFIAGSGIKMIEGKIFI